MGDLSTLQKRYYVKDAYGNYYRLDENNHLVVAVNKGQAMLFSFFEAYQHIGDGKKSRFYTTEPFDGTTVQKPEPNISQVQSIKTKDAWLFDMESIDWLEYVKKFRDIIMFSKKYHDVLNQKLSGVDMEISDIMHYVELFEMNDSDRLHAVDLLQEACERRRHIKDEIVKVQYFTNTLGTQENLVKAQSCAKQIGGLSTRKYKPRVLQDLYKDAVYRKAGETEQKVEIVEKAQINEEGEKMEYIRCETVYDTKKMDWLTFAREQVEFFENAKQHIHNLQFDLDEIDLRIEDILKSIEEVKFNAAQGYTVFKNMQQLRNDRKVKEKELAMLQVMVECFDCQAMAEIHQCNVNAIEDIMGIREEQAPESGEYASVS